LGDNKEVVIEMNEKTNLNTASDTSLKKKQILSEWEEEMYLRERQFLSKFPPEIIEIATTSAQNVYISPDKKRIIYTANKALTLPGDIMPPLPASNTQPETRTLETNSVYVYDREEDKNFLIATINPSDTNSETPDGADGEINSENTDIIPDLAKQLLATDLYNKKANNLDSSPSAFTTLQATDSAQTAHNFNIYHSPLFGNGTQWFTDSKHILFANDGHIKIMEYDASNNTTLYSGPFENDFVYPWPDGSKLVILTSFSPDSPSNLYAVELKR